MKSKINNRIICSVCNSTTHSYEYTPSYCAKCGHKFVSIYPIRKATKKERQSDKNCFNCVHNKGNGLNRYCALKEMDTYIYPIFETVCDNFTRAEWSKEVIEELMNMPRG